jgi:hypothetical protein
VAFMLGAWCGQSCGAVSCNILRNLFWWERLGTVEASAGNSPRQSRGAFSNLEWLVPLEVGISVHSCVHRTLDVSRREWHLSRANLKILRAPKITRDLLTNQ